LALSSAQAGLGGQFLPALVRTGFLQATSQVTITSLLDYLPQVRHEYGLEMTLVANKLSLYGINTTDQQMAVISVVCTISNLPAGCGGISGVNSTGDATSVGVYLGVLTDADISIAMDAVNEAVLSGSMASFLGLNGFSTVSRVSIAGSIDGVTPFTSHASSTIVSTSLGVNNVGVGALTRNEEAAFLTTLSLFLNIAQQFISVNGMSSSSRRKLNGVVGTGVPDTYVGITVDTPNVPYQLPNGTVVTWSAYVQMQFVRNDTYLLTLLQDNGLPQVTVLSVGVPLAWKLKTWTQPSYAYAYAMYQLVGLTQVTNVSSMIMEAAVAQVLGLQAKCVYTVNTRQPNFVGIAVAAPCVVTDSDRWTTIAALKALTPSIVGAATKSALATAVSTGGLPQVKQIDASTYEPPPPSPPPSPPPPPPPLPPSPPPPPAYALHDTVRYDTFRFITNGSDVFVTLQGPSGPGTLHDYDNRTVWASAVAELVHQRLVTLLTPSVYSQITVDWEQTLLVTVSASARAGRTLPSSDELRIAARKAIYDQCGVLLPERNVTTKSTDGSFENASFVPFERTTYIEVNLNTSNYTLIACEKTLNYSALWGTAAKSYSSSTNTYATLHVTVPVFDASQSGKATISKTVKDVAYAYFYVISIQEPFTFNKVVSTVTYRSSEGVLYVLILATIASSALGLLATMMMVMVAQRTQIYMRNKETESP
jgi:hypothetical protein